MKERENDIMPEFLKNVTWIHTVAGMIAAVLGVAIAWNTLGWDTVAMSSEVEEVKAQVIEVAQQTDNYYTEQKGDNDDTKLMLLYFRLSDHRNNVADERRKLALNPSDGVAAERIKNITSDMDRIQRAINKIEGRPPTP